MIWSWKVGRIAGIDVYIHTTFVVLLAWIVLSNSGAAQSGQILLELVFVTLVFAIILLHELGHALAARRYGIGTKDITLLPIGGVARLERMPEDPTQELVVALAGPAVNVVLALLIFVLSVVTPEQLLWKSELMQFRGELLTRLFWTNIVLVVFNLLPAFPMDGGRVLRALLGYVMEFPKATRIAAGVGQVMAMFFGFLGLLYGQPLLVLVAFFVWVGAQRESEHVQVKASFQGVTVAAVMVKSFDVLTVDQPLKIAVEKTLAGFQVDFPVLNSGGELVGMLTRQGLMKGLSSGGDQVQVSEAMQQTSIAVAPDDLMQSIFERVEEHGLQSIPVVDSGRIVGLLTVDNIQEYLLIANALTGKPSQAAHR